MSKAKSGQVPLYALARILAAQAAANYLTACAQAQREDPPKRSNPPAAIAAKSS